MSSARVVVALLLIIAFLATQIGTPIINAFVVPFFAALLATHVDRWGGELARSLVRAAAGLLPRADRADFCDEWLDHVQSAGEHGLPPLTRAITIALIAAPSLALGLRVGRRKRSRAG